MSTHVWLLVHHDDVVQNFLSAEEARAAGERIVTDLRRRADLPPLYLAWELEPDVDGRLTAWRLSVISRTGGYRGALDVWVRSYEV